MPWGTFHTVSHQLLPEVIYCDFLELNTPDHRSGGHHVQLKISEVVSPYVHFSNQHTLYTSHDFQSLLYQITLVLAKRLFLKSNSYEKY